MSKHLLIFIVSFIVVAICGFSAQAARAAVISFDPQESTVGTTGTFLVGITIDSEEPLSAIRGVIDIPKSFELVDVSDGNSVINLWIDRPHLNDAHQLIFSGLVPGGFSGLRGKLLTLTLHAAKEGSYTLIVSPSSQVFENSETPRPRPIISAPVTLRAIPQKENLANIIADKIPPEPFVPVYVKTEGGPSSSTAVYFVAQDKGSGIASYQAAESPYKYSRPSRLDKLSWRTVTAPYILEDQTLSSYVYIRAVDKSGNIRTALLSPLNQQMWYSRFGWYIIGGIVLIAFVFLRILKKR